jgi:hypothetical protein
MPAEFVPHRKKKATPMGTVEEAGGTARTLIQSLASTPVILALVVFNLFYIAMATYLQIKQSDRFTQNQEIWERMTEKAMSVCAGNQPPRP